MIKVTASEAKTNFHRLIEQVGKGETVSITSELGQAPLARLVAIPPCKPLRLGALETLGFVLSPTFFEPLPEEDLVYWDEVAAS